MKYIRADYIKALMKNDRIMQGNCEYELWKQEVDRCVDAMPSIEVESAVEVVSGKERRMSTEQLIEYYKNRIADLQSRVAKLSWNADVASEALDIAWYMTTKVDEMSKRLDDMKSELKPVQEAVLENKIRQIFSDYSEDQIWQAIKEVRG